MVLFLARKEDETPNIAVLLRPFYKTSLFLLKSLWPRFPNLFSSSQVEQDLIHLHPGEGRECIKTEYYARKMALCQATILIGTLLGAAAKFSVQEGMILKENGVIIREGYQEGSREIKVAAEYKKQRMEFAIKVEPRQLRGEEVERLMDEMMKNLPIYILGENESLNQVSKDLILKDEYGNYPVEVTWKSERQDVLSNTGHIFSIEKRECVKLSVCLRYGEYSREEDIIVTLTPPLISEEEQLYRDMEQLLMQSHDDSLEEKEWILPAKWKEDSIHWEQVTEDNSLLLWAAALGTAVLLFWSADRDLHQQIEQRKKCLRGEYPEIVHQLVLFVGAGMTIRGAFQKIAGDYEKKEQCGKLSPACEEMLYTCRELYAGVSESAAYEHFGRRTGLQEYVRLSTLLTQNLKRGNRTILERLREEADKAAEVQLQLSRKVGEEAGTKLLAPMVLLLAVVMIVIMIPAFWNM